MSVYVCVMCVACCYNIQLIIVRLGVSFQAALCLRARQPYMMLVQFTHLEKKKWAFPVLQRGQPRHILPHDETPCKTALRVLVTVVHLTTGTWISQAGFVLSIPSSGTFIFSTNDVSHLYLCVSYIKSLYKRIHWHSSYTVTTECAHSCCIKSCLGINQFHNVFYKSQISLVYADCLKAARKQNR